MNTDLIDILEVLIDSHAAFKHLCILFGPSNKCAGISCNECLLNTNVIYVSDYPIRIIQVRESFNE